MIVLKIPTELFQILANVSWSCFNNPKSTSFVWEFVLALNTPVENNITTKHDTFNREINTFQDVSENVGLKNDVVVGQLEQISPWLLLWLLLIIIMITIIIIIIIIKKDTRKRDFASSDCSLSNLTSSIARLSNSFDVMLNLQIKITKIITITTT